MSVVNLVRRANEKTEGWRPICSVCGREKIKWVTPKDKSQEPAYRCTSCRTLWNGSELTPAQAEARDAKEAARKSKIVKALSVRQPWAWFIVYLDKDIENRSKASSHRGPLLIHASKDMTKLEYNTALEYAREIKVDTSKVPTYEEMLKLCGGIVGKTNLYDVLAKTEEPTRKWHMPRQFGHMLGNTKPIDFFPCSGNQGFWEAETIYDAITERDAAKAAAE